MSCVTIIGRNRYFGPECDVPLKWSIVPWTQSKMDRLARMAADSNWAVRQVAAEHPRVDPATLMRLLMDEDVRVRRAAVKNPSITPRLLEIALMDQDMGIQAYAKLLGGGS
jgi:hypothetical protein